MGGMFATRGGSMAGVVPGTADIELHRGNDFELIGTIYTDESKDTEFNLTGCTLESKVIDNFNDRNTLATFDSDVIDPTNGVIRCFLARATVDALTADSSADNAEAGPLIGHWYLDIIHGGTLTSWLVNGALLGGETTITYDGGAATDEIAKWAAVQFASQDERYEINAVATGASGTFGIASPILTAVSNNATITLVDRKYPYAKGRVTLDRHDG
jgi:hypothetical protein